MSGSPISGTSYITVQGLERDTSLPQKVIKKVVQQLEKAGLLETFPDRHGSWRVKEMALTAALV
jgi:DNA-binding IscR family transcriptional regulator